MTDFHAVMIDETGCEFGVSFRAAGRAAAYDYLTENYPESRCDQLETPEDTRAREQSIYDRVARELDGGGYYYEYEDEDESDDSWDDYTDEERAEQHQQRAEAGETN